MYDSVASPEESTFRACLLERCLAEENKIISRQETSEENMRGFAMFLAEIYTQLEDSQVSKFVNVIKKMASWPSRTISECKRDGCRLDP